MPSDSFCNNQYTLILNQSHLKGNHNHVIDCMLANQFVSYVFEPMLRRDVF